MLGKYKVAKHFILDITEDGFTYHRNEERIREEARLDGVYVIRTSVDADEMEAEAVVRGYKDLSQVEWGFRDLKTVHLEVRPIRHRLEKRVRAHAFICMLAYYVVWHLRRAWRPSSSRTTTSRQPALSGARSWHPLDAPPAHTARPPRSEPRTAFPSIASRRFSTTSRPSRKTACASEVPPSTRSPSPPRCRGAPSSSWTSPGVPERCQSCAPRSHRKSLTPQGHSPASWS